MPCGYHLLISNTSSVFRTVPKTIKLVLILGYYFSNVSWTIKLVRCYEERLWVVFVT